MGLAGRWLANVSWMPLRIVYLLMRWQFSLVAWCSGERAEDAELLVLRHENAVLRRTLAGCGTGSPTDLVHRAYAIHPTPALGRSLPRDRDATGLAPQTRRDNPTRADGAGPVGRQQPGASPGSPSALAREWSCPALTDRADGLSGYLPEVLFSGGGFVFGGAEVAEGAVQAGAVVPGDVFDDRPAGCDPCRP